MAFSSKERLLRAIRCEPADYVPLCFLMWAGLEQRSSGTEDYVQRQLGLGLDAVVPLPALAWGHDPRVEIEQWKEHGDPYPLLHKLYRTPEGDIETIVEQTPDWPHGDDVPMLGDFNIPRSTKFHVTDEGDLGPLKWLLGDPDAAAIERFRRRAEELRLFVDEHGLALITPLFRLADTVCWLCGPTQFATWGLTQPEFLADFVRLVAQWQRTQLELQLRARPDIVARAEWYATPFLSPDLFDRFLSPILQEEVELTHRAGACYCYVGTANMMPFLGILKRIGVDVVYGVDPIEGQWDLRRAKAECRDSLCLWGGMNGYLQVVRASQDEVEQAVRSAMDALAPGGGFVLCPVDDVGLGGTDQNTDAMWQKAWDNVVHMVETWKRLR